MGVCTKRSALLASDRTNFSSSQSPSATTDQHLNLDFSATTDSSLDWNPVCLDILDLASCGGCYNPWHSDSLVESQLLGPLLACCLKSLIVDKRIYISMDPLNWWCYFLSRRWYVAWCAKIDHLILTLPACCCTCCIDGLGLYHIWFIVVHGVCSDEPWSI